MKNPHFITVFGTKKGIFGAKNGIFGKKVLNTDTNICLKKVLNTDTAISGSAKYQLFHSILKV